MRRAAIVIALLLAGCGGGGGAARTTGKVKVDRVDLKPGSMGIIVTNGTDAPAQLSQVAVDNGFVAFDGPARTVAAHATTRLIIPYPWIAGQAYSVKILTGQGEALEYQLEPQ